MKYLMIYLLLINAAGLLLMRADKRRAIKNARRIPEVTLLSLAAVGGSIGIIMGMRLFRHKTLHFKFSIGVPVLLGVQITLFCLFFYRWI